ncbi:MAG: hypothetical protein IKT00_08045 [Prevotella sp.]|nr:hypothetical protein [Prevotella sp.]
MKQRIFVMLAAMLLSIGAFAQSGNQPLKGDVNEDGRVDVADVVAIVDIILKGGSTPQPTTYYWYVDQTQPESTNNVTTVTGANPGWHEIGTSIGTYTFADPLYNSESNPIASNPSANAAWYVAVPSTSSLGVYDSVDRNEVTNGNWTTEQPITVTGITYNVYKSVGTYRKFNVWWVH